MIRVFKVVWIIMEIRIIMVITGSDFESVVFGRVQKQERCT